jgi:hypothetical protein
MANKKICSLLLFLFFYYNLSAKILVNELDTSIRNSYLYSFEIIRQNLRLNKEFKYSVYTIESTNQKFKQQTISKIEHAISKLKKVISTLYKYSRKEEYKSLDSSNYFLNWAISECFKKSMKLITDSSILFTTHFRFNRSDPLGKKDIRNTFVSNLLATHQGNCHSLTYLYKILADELGAKCWISLAPGHMYIKNYSEKVGWYNTELTSGTFPTDAYIMASSYINPKAVISGMYMDTLSNQQAIALCVLDLAHLYERQTKNYYDGFILKCCDLVLQYHPVNPMALLLKAETLKKVAIREKSTKYPKLTYTVKEMEATYLKLFDLGYREMPSKMKAQKRQQEKQNARKARQ